MSTMTNLSNMTFVRQKCLADIQNQLSASPVDEPKISLRSIAESITRADVFESSTYRVHYPRLAQASTRETDRDLDLRSAMILYSAFKHIPLGIILDRRQLAYMALVQYRDYLEARYAGVDLLENTQKLKDQVLPASLSQSSILRHVLGRLIVPAAMIGDNPKSMQLLQEYYSHSDYYSLFVSLSSRSPQVWRAVLSYVVDNRAKFVSSKEAKVRAIFRAVNQLSARKPIGVMNMDGLCNEMDRCIDSYRLLT